MWYNVSKSSSLYQFRKIGIMSILQALQKRELRGSVNKHNLVDKSSINKFLKPKIFAEWIALDKENPFLRVKIFAKIFPLSWFINIFNFFSFERGRATYHQMIPSVETSISVRYSLHVVTMPPYPCVLKQFFTLRYIAPQKLVVAISINILKAFRFIYRTNFI